MSDKTCDMAVANSRRTAARVFAGMGGAIWIFLTFGAAIVYPNMDDPMRFIGFVVVVVLAAIAFGVGWFNEYFAAAVLFVGAAGAVVWGVSQGWELGVWGIMAIFLFAPMIIAGVLYVMAAQMTKLCEAQATDVSGE